MIKETIRAKHLNNNGLSVNNTTVGKAIQKSAFDAMDEYAIGFAKFIGGQSLFAGKNPKGIVLWHKLVGGENFTTEKLLELYNKEK
jgi:hypothetical protein